MKPRRDSLPRPLRLCLLGLLVPLAGCEYFQDTTVPKQDEIPPAAVATLFDSVEKEHGWPDGGLVDTADPDELFVPIAAGLDAGGVRRVTLRPEFTVSYDPQSWSTSFLTPVLVDAGPAAVGDIVSNGQYVADPFRFRDFLDDPSLVAHPDHVRYLGYTYEVEVLDFHGNAATFSGPAVRYRP